MVFPALSRVQFRSSTLGLPSGTMIVMEPDWTQAVLSLGVGVGLAAAAGLRVFLPMLLLAAAARSGWVTLGDDFQWIASGFAVGAFGAATILEIAAYYLPWLDNLLDAAAGPSAVIAGIVATAAVTSELPPPVRWSAAIIAGGGTAGVVQSLTSIARLKSTLLTGGLGNPVIATFEWAGSLVTSIVAIVLPLLAIVIVIGLSVLAVSFYLRARRRVPSSGPGSALK
jgi:hypothetical protein